VTDDEGAEDTDAADELSRLARRLIEARPSMAALRNRVDRVMATADDPDAVEGAATDAIDRAVAADDEAARNAAERVAGERVLTLSRSGTVLTALQGLNTDSGDEWADPPEHVFVAESRPAREGVDVAETLAESVPVTVHTDAAAGHVLAEESVDAVLVGADTVLPDGRVLNKTGTRTIAAAAAREDVPVFAVTAADKVSSEDAVNREFGPGSDLYDGDAPVTVLNPTFDVTPADLIDGVVTERGTLSTDAVRDVAAEHRENADWSL
jgi:translation initiation factor 2B subunit (eIF-2B alpha/beta/delta family)